MYFQDQPNKRTTHLCVFFYLQLIMWIRVPRDEGGGGLVSQTQN